jgi:NADPH:quinone reductase-like Zn-dependent oxidoreductase
LSVAFALLVKCATATHPHSGWATPALLSTPTNAMTPAKSKTLTIRLLGSDDFPADAKEQAARDLTSAAAAGALHIEVGQSYPLHRIADAHDHVDAGTRGRVLVDIPQ